VSDLDLREVQHVVDQLREALALAHDDREVVADLLDGLLDLAVVGHHAREDPLLEPLPDDLREPEHRGERGAQLVADRREEGALGGVGLLGGRARLPRLLEQPRVLERHAHVGRDRGEQPLVALREPPLDLGALHAQHADDLAAGRDRHPQVGLRGAARPLDLELLAPPPDVLVDQERLAGLDDARGHPGPERDGLEGVAVAVLEVNRLRRLVEQRDVGHLRVEHLAHLVAHERDERVEADLGHQRLADAVDRGQLRGSLPDLVLLLVELPVRVGVVERDAGVGREVLQQVQVVLGVGVLLEALHRDHAQHAVLREQREVDQRLGRL
jgi:hypothetical protein